MKRNRGLYVVKRIGTSGPFYGMDTQKAKQYFFPFDSFGLASDTVFVENYFDVYKLVLVKRRKTK